MRDQVTTLLDLLGVLLVATGAAFALAPIIGGAALIVAGGILLTASWWATR